MHGVALPLSALRTEQSCGIGEYLDLIPFIDWCADVGFTLIQLLPLNDTGPNASPYSATSVMDLHPIYLRLPTWVPSNTPGRLHYSHILHQKQHLLRDIPDIQGLCHEQLLQARAHADKRGIQLIGDIPLLLSPDSVDVRKHPDLFDTSMAVGCPPDLFTSKGQYWGFPAYRWDEHRATHFAWWRQRLRLAEQYYHAYRIDHVVGFFHLWLIPRGKKPTEGSYHPHHFDEWMRQGTELMEMMLSATSMWAIGEDLGVVPTAVRRCLHRLGIYTTKMLPWERRLGGYLPGDQYPEMSMTTLGTHDAMTLSQWWKAFPDQAQDLAALIGVPYTPEFSCRTELLRYSHHTRSRLHINPIQEYLALCPDLVEKDERINIPGTHSRRNWSYRMKRTLEELVTRDDLKQKIRDIIS